MALGCWDYRYASCPPGIFASARELGSNPSAFKASALASEPSPKLLLSYSNQYRHSSLHLPVLAQEAFLVTCASSLRECCWSLFPKFSLAPYKDAGDQISHQMLYVDVFLLLLRNIHVKPLGDSREAQNLFGHRSFSLTGLLSPILSA